MTKKREEVPYWDSYFMGLAAIASFRSKDPNTQNGACLIRDDSPIALGYNGFPRGCSDDEFPWSSPEKLAYAEHAERNAIYNAARKGIATEGAVLYLYSERGYYPCADCARAIIQAGITRVVMAYSINEDTENWHWGEPLKMFESAGVIIRVVSDSVKGKGVNYDDWPEHVPIAVEGLVRDFRLMAKKLEEAADKIMGDV